MLKHTRARLSLWVGATLLAISLPLIASAANVVLNPGFETGTGNAATNWTATTFKPTNDADNNAAFSVVADAHSGTRAAKVAITSYVAGDAKWVPDAVAVTAGQFYTISFWYKSNTPTSAFVAYNGDFSCCWIGDLPAAPAWTQFQTTVLVPAGKTSLQTYLALNSVGELTTDDYSMDIGTTPTFSQGHVTLTFDDGWQSFNDVAVPTLNTHGLKATAYIITGPEGSNVTTANPNPGYMSKATITALQTAGFEVGGHTTTHYDLVGQATGAGQLYATQAAMWQGEIFDSRTALTSNGFSPVTTFAYPYGQYNTDVKAQVQAAGFTSARSVDQGFNFVNTDKYALKIMPINNQSTAAGINALIDQAVSDKTWLILMFHNVRAGNETQGSLNAACVEPVIDANGNPVVPAQTQPDVDCTTQGVLDGIAAHLQAAPVGTTVTMGQGVAAMDAANHTITAGTADANGTISPTGSVSVVNGASQTFTITPNADFVVSALTVDGAPVTPATTYTFDNVTANHSIQAAFAPANAITTVTLGTTAVSPTNVATIPVTVTFSKAVTGFEATDVAVTGATLSNFAGTGAAYTFDLTPSADGTVTAQVLASTTVDTLPALNDNFASNMLSVVSNRTSPIITLVGNPIVVTKLGDVYADQGATVSPTGITITTNAATISTSTANVATVTYDAVDTAGNHAAQVTRTVIVSELEMSGEQSADVGQNSVTIKWTTVQPGTSRVVYDTVSHNPLTATTTNWGYANSTTEDAEATTTHSVVVSGLTAGTTYYFRPISHGSPEAPGAQISVTTTGAPASSGSGSSSGSSSGGGGGGGPIVGTYGGGGAGGAGFYFTSAPATTIGGGTTGGAVLGASTFKFLNDLKKGMKHGDVMELQKRMVSEGFLTIDVPTNYFGSMTESAVRAYQLKHGLPAVGRVGPMTRATLNGETASTGSTSMMDDAKAALIAKLKEQLKVLMDKIAALMAGGASTGTASSTPATTGTTTPAMTSTSTVMTDMTASTTAAVTASSTATTASSAQQ